jgi:hypothetical protein
VLLIACSTFWLHVATCVTVAGTAVCSNSRHAGLLLVGRPLLLLLPVSVWAAVLKLLLHVPDADGCWQLISKHIWQGTCAARYAHKSRCQQLPKH